MSKVKATKQDENGRNTHFKDSDMTNQMSRESFVKKIKAGKYPEYHIRVINDVETPVSNPDRSNNNNLD